MRLAIRVTQDEVADMLRLRKEGRTQKEIAEWIGCSEVTVRRFLRLNGVVPSSRRWTDTDVTKLLGLLRQGLSGSDMAEQMGRTYKATMMELYILRHRLGVKRVPKMQMGPRLRR